MPIDFMQFIRSRDGLAGVPHRDIEHGYSQYIRETAEELIGLGLDPRRAAVQSNRRKDMRYKLADEPGGTRNKND